MKGKIRVVTFCCHQRKLKCAKAYSNFEMLMRKFHKLMSDENDCWSTCLLTSVKKMKHNHFVFYSSQQTFSVRRSVKKHFQQQPQKKSWGFRNEFKLN